MLDDPIAIPMENTSQAVSRVSIETDLRVVPLAATVVVLWVYIVSNYAYWTWYLATAAAVAVVSVLVVAGVLRTDGLRRAIAPVIAYFAVLLSGVAWAMAPADTVRWVAIDSIGMAVFALAFIAGRNATPGSVAGALMTLAIPAVAIAAIMHAIDPTVPRIAQYAVALLPFVTPFAYWKAVTARPRWPAVLTLAVTFAILVFGRSRTHLGTAVLLTALAVVIFCKSGRAALREVLAGAAVIAATVAALLLVPVTRTEVATMFVRMTGIGVFAGDLKIPAEPVNPQRVALAEVSKVLLAESMPLGIGYGNFVRRFQGMTGYGLQVHNVYVAWLLEGGLLCVGVVLVLAWMHVRSLSLYIREARTAEQRAYGQACAIASAGILTVGLFHQVHQTPALWMLLGFGAACGAEARSRRQPAASDASPLLELWRRSGPSFAPALCEPLMVAAFRHLSRCERDSLIADVGCGTGFMLRVLREGGYRAVGFDADPAMALQAAAAAAEGEQLPLRSGGLDGVFVFSAFQYMDRPRALEECRRVLRPGGRIVVIENLADNFVAKLSRLMRRMRGLGYPRYMEPRSHLRWRDRAVYERYFSDVTYEVHHVVAPLFLFSSALDVPAPPSRRNRAIVAALRVVQRLERRALAAGWFRGAAWHVVITGRK